MISIFKTIYYFFIGRFRIFLVKRTVKSFAGKIYVGGKTRLSSNTVLGENVSFNGMSVNGIGKVYFGNNFHSGTDCLIITSIHNYDFGKTIPYDNTHIAKDVQIADNVWFGDRVTIIGRVTIGEGAIVQAGAVVISDIPDLAIVGGNPAKIFKYRNSDHYYKLKEQNKFH